MSTELMVETDFSQLAPSDAGVQGVLAAGGAMQQVRGTYTTAVAVQQPRSLQLSRKRLIEEATLAGDLFYYGWGAGKDKIEGASVKLAMAAARCWGNCVVESLPVQEAVDSWIFTSAFVDLETGFTLTRQFRQSKRWVVFGKHDPERKDDIRFQIGQSKAARNVILNALPEWLIDNAVEQAKAGVRAKIEGYVKTNGLPAAVDLVVKGLEKAGVGEPLILAKCEVAHRNGLTLDHLVMLRGDLTAIQGGQERPEVLFPGPDDGPANGAKVRRSDLNEKVANGGKAPVKPADPTRTAEESQEREPGSDDGPDPLEDALQELAACDSPSAAVALQNAVKQKQPEHYERFAVEVEKWREKRKPKGSAKQQTMA